jgi:gamma-glutamyltranspeptidase
MGGNAVDAAITAALCNSVVLLHLSGLGGQVKLYIT